jgi:hypothetical protein
MMQFHGLIHKLPKEIKNLILIFILVLSIGFYGGLFFVDNTTSMELNGIESRYLGNENDANAKVMLFKKSKSEMLTIVHNHILSMSVIFFLMALLVSITSLPKKLKYFLMFEPFASVLLTFGGIYILWNGVLWFKYIILLSGILMTLSYTLALFFIIQQLYFKNIK